MRRARPRALLRRRSRGHSQLQLDRSARTTMATAPETRMSIADVKRFYHQINTSGQGVRAKPWRDRDWMDAALVETSSARAGFAHKPSNSTDDCSSSHNRHLLAAQG